MAIRRCWLLRQLRASKQLAHELQTYDLLPPLENTYERLRQALVRRVNLKRQKRVREAQHEALAKGNDLGTGTDPVIPANPATGKGKGKGKGKEGKRGKKGKGKGKGKEDKGKGAGDGGNPTPVVPTAPAATPPGAPRAAY